MHRTLVKLSNVAVATCLVSGLLMLSACGSSDEEKALAQETKKPLGVGSTEKANAEIEAAVRAMLAGDPQLRGSQIAVSADVTRNQVTLSGTVSSEALRAKAVELAKSAQAGVIVSDKIKLKSNESNLMSPGRKSGYA